MNQYKKKDILKTVSLLLEANETLSRVSIKKRTANLIEVLGECQQTALLLGNYLETQEEIGQEAVSILENYCENLYQMSLHNTDENIFRKISKKISKQLNELSTLIRYEMPMEKKEIVFFPYKASMWDSLESIWKAALADKNCITYVVPIPYYDKKSDGSLGAMHDESDEYPDYVKITSWKEYNIKEHRPDIAYVHNPYDNWNLVTCIHPDFFAEELKKYVDFLIYVPYFICVNDRIPPHLCVTPVTIFADRIVVQSENIRQIYIKELRKYGRENNCLGILGNIERKVLALGSPKSDRVKHYLLDEESIPEDWRKVLYLPDGTRKKIVLYNTSIQNILNYGKDTLDKIEDSFRIFEAYKEKIALIWRPHPLIWATLQAMRPELCSQYNRLVNAYRKEKWGIYDNTPDLNRAISISDAYYGDGGSLLELYRSTGKPCLKQTINVVEMPADCKWRKRLTFEAGYIDAQDNLWLSAAQINGLFRYGLRDGILHYIGKFEAEGSTFRYLHSEIVEYDGKLYFAPYTADYIDIFDKNTGEFSTISFDSRGEVQQKFYAMVRYKNSLFLFAGRVPYIVRIDLETNEIQYIEKPVEDMAHYFQNDKFVILNKYVAVQGSRCFLASARANILLEFDMDTLEHKIHQIGKEDDYFAGVFGIGSDIYLIPRNEAEIIRWNSETGKQDRIAYPKGHEAKECGFFAGAVSNQELWLFPFKDDMIIKKSSSDTKFTLVESVDRYEDTSASGNKFTGLKFSWAAVHNGKIYYMSEMNRTLYGREMGADISERTKLLMTDEMYKGYLKELYRDSPLHAETEKINLPTMLDCLCMDFFNTILGEQSKGDISVGEKCHIMFRQCGEDERQ